MAEAAQRRREIGRRRRFADAALSVNRDFDHSFAPEDLSLKVRFI